MQIKSNQQQNIEKIRREFNQQNRPEGFYLSRRDHRFVRRLIQHLQSPTPFGFVHSQDKRLGEYYFDIIVNRLRITGNHTLIFWDTLKKRRIIDLLNSEIKDLAVENVTQPKGNDEFRKLIIIPRDSELTVEDWQDIETLCLELPGSNLGILCGCDDFAGESPIRSERLVKDKRIFHIDFSLPRPDKAIILSALARGSSRHGGILEVLKKLGIYESRELERVDTTVLKNNGSHDKALFEGYLESAKTDMAARQGGSPVQSRVSSASENDVTPDRRYWKAIRYALLITAVLATGFALIMLNIKCA